MKDRLKLFRETIGKQRGVRFSQQALADECNVSRDVISNYEMGRVEPPKLFLKYLSKEYGVNETWLLTGNGNMFDPPSEEQELASIFASCAKGDDYFLKELIKMVAKLSPETKNELAKSIMDLADKLKDHQD